MLLREIDVGHGDDDGEGQRQRFGAGNDNGNVKGNGHRLPLGIEAHVLRSSWAHA